MNIFTETEKLAEAQLQEFELAKINYANLKKQPIKRFPLEHTHSNCNTIRTGFVRQQPILPPGYCNPENVSYALKIYRPDKKVFHTDKTTISSSIPIRFFKSISQFRPRHTPLSS